MIARTKPAPIPRANGAKDFPLGFEKSKRSIAVGRLDPAAIEPTEHAAPSASAIPLAAILVADNVRTEFDTPEDKELIESVRTRGILQPLLVRPIPNKGTYRFELICGERRYRAATAAGLQSVPAHVRDVPDAERLEIQLIENLHKEGLTELDEANGYRRMQKDLGYDIDTIALKVGKKRRTVYSRLQLLQLTPAALKALKAGTLSPSVALLICRVPGPKLQDRALKEVLAPDSWQDEPMSVRAATEYLQESYTLDLKGAPFDPKNPTLVLAAGSCAACPKRTGNCADLFPEIKSADVCTDPDCFALKKAAGIAATKADAEAKGLKVLNAKDSKAALRYGGSHIQLSEQCWQDKKRRTYRELLGDKLQPTQIALAAGDDGKLLKVVDRKIAADLLKASGVKLPSETRSHSHSETPEAKAKREAEEKLQQQVQAAHLLAVTEAVAAKKIGDDNLWLLIALQLYEALDVSGEFMERHGWKASDTLKKIADLSETKQKALIVEMILDHSFDYWGNAEGKALQSFASACSVDLKAIERKVKERAKESEACQRSIDQRRAIDDRQIKAKQKGKS